MSDPDGDSESGPAPGPVPPVPVFDAVLVYNPQPAHPVIPQQVGPPMVGVSPWAGPPPYPPMIYPPVKRRRAWKPVLALAAVLGIGVAGVAVAKPSLLGGASAGTARGPAVVASALPPSPAAGALVSERLPWIRAQIALALQGQAAALLAGDEAGFLASVEAGNDNLTRELRRRYATLRAMQVTGWVEELDRDPTPVTGKGGRDEWRVMVDLQHCFVVPACVTDGLLAETRWVETPQGLRLAEFHPSESGENGPRPWEVTNLTVAVGPRTIVGVTPKYAKRLPELQRIAESAAALADRFVRGDSGPIDRYRIFMADGKEWQRWYGGEDLEWAAGYAVPTGDERIEVVLNLSGMPEDYVDDTLRHELAHVATLRAADYTDDTEFWWLIEGIADYVDELGVPVAEYDERDLVARYVDEEKMPTGVAVPPPDGDTEEWQVAARYGIGYYAVRRIAERFGEPAMLAFFDAVVRDGTELADAAPATLGVSWDDVNDDCLKNLKKVT